MFDESFALRPSYISLSSLRLVAMPVDVCLEERTYYRKQR